MTPSTSTVEELKRIAEASRGLEPVFQEPDVTFLRSPLCGEDGLYPWQVLARDALRSIYAHEDGGRVGGPRRGRNILVASATGSGKTYAIQEAARLSQARGTRLFVAEPLVALAIQIFERLGGLRNPALALRTGMRVAGDPDQALVHVCTYEALARLLATDAAALDGSPLLVIDEFHAIGGERGPVLLEVLHACAAAGTPVAALSGTLPNAAHVAGFLAASNGMPCVVMGATRRPVELVYESYDARAAGLAVLAPGADLSVSPDARAVGGIESRQDVLALLRELRTRDRTCALVVNFSCRRLDEWAAAAADVDWTEDRGQRSMVARSFDAMLARVPEEDRCLFAELRRWAMRGVAVHHSQRPTQYLELVSHLAERRCLAFVLSTSTLSAGINMPVRTVVLTSARIPSAARVRDLDASLFHQLAGRAGRPGLEPEGFVAVVARGSVGLRTAQALRDRPPEPVRPYDEIAAGDVLRAVRQGRSVASDRLIFDLAGLARARAAERSARLRDAAMALLGEDERRAAGGLAAVAAAVLSASEPLLRLARPASKEILYLARGAARCGYEITRMRIAGAVQLTTWKAATRLPAEGFGAILELRGAISELLRATAAGPAILLAAAVAVNAWEDGAALRAAPGFEEEAGLLRELTAAGCLDGAGALTAKGLAACELRTFVRPHVALDLALERGVVDAREVLAMCSLLLGDGRAAQEGEDAAGGGDEGAVDAVFAARARARQDCSERRLVLAVSCWADGRSVADVVAATGVPVGHFCRHAVRVGDAVRELRLAVRALGAELPNALEALLLLERGLPFLGRDPSAPEREP